MILFDSQYFPRASKNKKATTTKEYERSQPSPDHDDEETDTELKSDHSFSNDEGDQPDPSWDALQTEYTTQQAD